MKELDKFIQYSTELKEDEKGQLQGGFTSDLDAKSADALADNYGICNNYFICDDNYGICSNSFLCLTE